jgi:hypothetical protein
MNNMILDRYKQNLSIHGNKVYSYATHVATLNHADRILHIHGWWSATTSKHVNYVANQFNYEKSYDSK